MSYHRNSEADPIAFWVGVVLLALVFLVIFLAKRLNYIARAIRIDPANRCLWVAIALALLAAWYAAVTHGAPLALVLCAISAGALFFVSKHIQEGS